MKLVLDTGALVALERDDRGMWRRLKAALAAERAVVTHGGIVGQAWRRGGPRQALLARALGAVDVRPLDGPLGKAAGELLALTRGADVIDAALVRCAVDDDEILTSDPDDLAVLAEAADLHVDIVPV